jgi:hypothetical protein
MKGEEARQSLPAADTDHSPGDGSTRHAAHRPSPLQTVVGETGDAIGLVDKLDGRARAVAIDIVRRQVARLMRRNRPLLEEWELWPEEPASISIEWTRGRARIRTRGTHAELQELKRWLLGNDAAYDDLAACVRFVMKGER